ncbi:MAG: translation initiation factor IF-2 [Victivallales bacterium]|nr:translation initiation factor IF-2 [Victivallales bacterium]
MKKVKIKELAQKYGVSPKEIIRELASEGIETDGLNCTVSSELAELLREHFEEVFSGNNESKEDAASENNAGSGGGEVHLKSPIIVKNMADAVGKKPNVVISDLMGMGIIAAINQTVPPEAATKLCRKYGFELVLDKRDKAPHAETVEKEELANDFVDRPEDIKPRPPVVTFLGHVDHGKTSLQDQIRHSHVASGEAGGITQHIGASTVNYKGRKITFIDTPGHEAFTQMRARGANTTDIAILVVAADDGFMPQTVEALNHARAAKVPIIVAINKMDLPDANADKVLLHMQQNGLMSEDWGGDIAAIRVSALTGMGLESLLERILLEAEMLELTANAKRPAEGIVLEAQLEQGLGPTAHILVKNGTLKMGDPLLCGEFYGKVKSMIDENGKRVKSAGPSTPVKLVGLSGVPEAGDVLKVCKDERDARHISEDRMADKRELSLSKNTGVSMEDIFSQMDAAQQNTLNIIVKSDVKGSGEAIVDSLSRLPSEKIKVDVVMNGVGAITENDVMLAAASQAIIVGFHVRVNPGVNALAKREKVEIRLYSIIYELLEDIVDALEGRLAPDKREKEIGQARILKIFSLSKGPKVCGCMVDKGMVKVGAKARVYRNKELIFNGEVRSLRRFHDDVKEVKAGLECGIRLDNFADFDENDMIQVYEVELSKASLA